MEELNFYTDKIIQDYNEQIEKLLAYKIMELKMKALQNGYNDLHGILSQLELTNVNKVKRQLEAKGYTLEIENPDFKFTSDNNVFKATLEMDKIKLKVRKLIFEI